MPTRRGDAQHRGKDARGLHLEIARRPPQDRHDAVVVELVAT
ncbi:hypothetical protein ACQPX6_08360 [Actinomycetospora sp. CA-101289]